MWQACAAGSQPLTCTLDYLGPGASLAIAVLIVYTAGFFKTAVPILANTAPSSVCMTCLQTAFNKMRKSDDVKDKVPWQPHTRARSIGTLAATHTRAHAANAVGALCRPDVNMLTEEQKTRYPNSTGTKAVVQ